MRLSRYHFRRHVTRRSRGISLVLGGVNPCDSHIGQPEISPRIEDEVFGFDIPVDDVVVVQIFETQKNAANKKLDDMFWKGLVFANLEAQITSWHVVHYQIQVASVLESKYHIHEKRVPQICQQLAFIHH